MKKSVFFAATILLLSAAVFGLEVDEDEIKSTSTTIEFINYTGPHKIIDSIDAIKSIGSKMGTIVANSTTTQITTGNQNKYYVVHAVDDTKGKLDADIIFIGADATVDHITNLRRIISAYLSSAYSYSQQDADTLAVFITVYNAVYRGNLSYFQSKYKDNVTKNLSTTNCGLSVNYKDWPGKSEIVIPLFDVKNGGLSTVDTSVISDSNVVDSMQEDDDKNVDTRKDMVDLKEREADDASKKAQDSQKKATEEQKKLNEEKQKTQEAKKEAEEAQKKADENPNDEEAQKEAEEKQQAAEEQQKKEDEQAQKTQEAKDTATEQQQIADKKQSEAQKERKEIAKDQQSVQEKESMPSDYGIILSNEEDLLSRLVKFNIETGETIKNSPVTVIRSRTIYKGTENFIAIAGEEGENSTIKLVSIDPDSMEINGESNETVASDSILVCNGEDYYCIINSNEKWILGKFDENLNLKHSSPVEVISSTPITITDAGIVVTGKSGKLKLLSLEDLTAIETPISAYDAK